MLTRKQAELLRFIHERLKEAGVPPSFDEMKDALDLRSKSGIHRLITALEERGFIRRLPNRARAIEVIKLPESVAHGMGSQRSRGFTPSVIEGNLGRVRAASDDDSGRPVAVPVMGRIAAGTPIEAIQTRSHTINMPPDLLSTGEHFALEVRGDSMIEDGDMALIKRSDAADTGDIVVALIDNEEATLKRFRRRGASIALEPANTTYEVRILPPNRVRIQGKLVGLFRRYRNAHRRSPAEPSLISFDVVLARGSVASWCARAYAVRGGLRHCGARDSSRRSRSRHRCRSWCGSW